ncbi:MAG: beta galactosidase jelly roll domain-containing protein [Oscillospiraceae bacterium]|nr:beta galactosidase jelly roll domain-containing protein [Oscillospiraceae bacterium]
MDTRSLCGIWELGADRRYTDPVRVPGSWRTVPAFRDHGGPVWYRTTFSLSPEEAARRLALRFGGVFRRARVWLNGERLAVHEGYQAPFRVDVSGRAAAGENVLEVETDLGRPAGAPDSGALWDITPLPLAGLYEPVTLELAASPRVCGIYAPLDPVAGVVRFFLTLRNDGDRPVSAGLTLRVRGGGRVETAPTRRLSVSPGESETGLALPAARFSLWSPESPALYDVEAELTFPGGRDVFSVRTGFKRLETVGRVFRLNGAPYYLLGYGDDFVFPGGIPPADDKTAFFRGIRRAKEYGFNFARHHSHFPFEAFLDAADELGLLLQPELALANVPREQLNDENKGPFLDEWRALIRAYRHHPCIAVWCGGNEMEWGFPFDAELCAEARRLDPFRPVSSTDGVFTAADVPDFSDFASICPAEYTDFLPWREWDDLFLRDDSGKPQLVHEMGNYTTVPDAADLGRYGPEAVRPRRLEALARLLDAPEKRALYDKALACSLSLQKLCHRLNIEKARLSPFFCGYHVWTLADYYETTQGILNPFFEDKAFTAEEFRRFNRQTVLLWDTARALFRAGEKTALAFRLSAFGPDLPDAGTLTLSLSDGQAVQTGLALRPGGLSDAARWELTLPSPAAETRYVLSAVFEGGGLTVRSEWPLFVCPPVSVGREKEIYLHYLARPLLQDAGVPFRYFTIPQPIGEDQLLITGFLYGGMTEAVERGASLLLLAGADTFRCTVTGSSFKAPWWEAGEIWYLNHTNNSQMCGVVEPHPATAMLPYTGGWQLDLFGAVEQAPAVDLDALALPADAALYGVDPALHRRAYLFEFRLGRGRVLVSALNHARSDLADPAVDYVLKSLINYAMSDRFRPDVRLTREQFFAALASPPGQAKP